MTISVLIADDQDIVRCGLRALVEACPGFTVVAEAADGAHAVSQARRHRPDVALVDLDMPYVDGITATVRLRALDSPAAVVVLTDGSAVADARAVDAFDAGASGFLAKEMLPGQLRSALRAAAAGGMVVSPEALDGIVRTITGPGASQFADACALLPELNESESKVLTLLGSGLSNLDIARRLHLSSASVKTYVSRLLGKLGLENRTQAAILAYEAGLVGGGRILEPAA
ncbi:response regulator transcription factor [Streptomyces sp. NPDC001262]|uniref:response regulator transcription factor n=1 Tax=Streptomyces TaxID=1883 RepID=UPI0036CAA980